jgi:hypothetical protein
MMKTGARRDQHKPRHQALSARCFRRTSFHTTFVCCSCFQVQNKVGSSRVQIGYSPVTSKCFEGLLHESIVGLIHQHFKYTDAVPKLEKKRTILLTFEEGFFASVSVGRKNEPSRHGSLVRRYGEAGRGLKRRERKAAPRSAPAPGGGRGKQSQQKVAG